METTLEDEKSKLYTNKHISDWINTLNKMQKIRYFKPNKGVYTFIRVKFNLINKYSYHLNYTPSNLFELFNLVLAHYLMH